MTLKNKPEVDQFCDGLRALDVLSAIRRHPVLFKPLFT